jgi:5'-deoxynucleotidase YfbR-like HD superfamily hydrolase
MSWIQTFSGKDFSFAYPRIDDIDLVDIAHSLSMQCRFNGHVQRFYSIAEHSYWASIRAADLAAAKVRSGEINQKHGVAITITALFHDAAEAYVGDMVRPLKKLRGMELFSEIEDKIIGIIQQKYGFPVDPIARAIVKQADNEMLAIEQRDLMSPCTRTWEGMLPIPEPSFVEIECWSPEVAEARWLRTARALGIK